MNSKINIHSLIPGGAHTYSKGDDQFSSNVPEEISHGKGAWVFDMDGNSFLDTTMGLASISLGHAYEPVLEAVKLELDKGVNFQRPSYIEREMAEAFLEVLPMHDMVKFAKNGSSVTTAAVKLARAHTGKSIVVFPKDHPFYSYDDWFIGKTVCDSGVPDSEKEFSKTFQSCDIDSLKAIFEKYPNKIACVISEPEKNTCSIEGHCKNTPQEFLVQAIQLCKENNALFILDEMQSGYRTAFPGSMTKYNLTPDLTTWGKGIANGFSFCALTGKKEVMELGGIIQKERPRVFLISTTNGAETHGLRAALKTQEIFKTQNVIEHNHKIGSLVIEKIRSKVDNAGLANNVQIIECPWYPAFNFMDNTGEVSLELKTLMIQEMIRRQVLFQGSFLPCYSHVEEDVEFFAKAFEESLVILKMAIKEGVEKHLVGDAIKPVFRNFN